MKNILAAIDYSPYSEQALKYAYHIAQKMGAKLTVMHAHLEKANTSDAVQKGELVEQQESNYNQESNKFNSYVQQLVAQSQHSTDEAVEIAYRFVRGITVFEILHLTQEMEVDLLVIGTKGESGIKEKIFGSNTQSIIERIKCPILAVPKSVQYSDFKTIVFATDLEERGSAAIGLAYDLSKAFEASLQFLHIKTEETRSHADKVLKYQHLIEEVVGEDKYQFVEIKSHPVLASIKTYTENNPVDLLVMPKSKKSSLDNLFTISMSKQIAFNGSKPVLIFKE